MPFLGESAALVTALMFSIGPTFFTLAGRRVGSVVVNRSRLLIATLVLMAIHAALAGGRPLPLDAGGARWLWLGLSGVVGLALGDAALFQAFVQIGTRLTMLVFALTPVVAAIQARIVFGEILRPVQILAMAVTLAGVAWVVTERAANGEGRRERHYLQGIGLALAGATGQATGLILARAGLQGDFSAFDGNVIRISSAAAAIWIATLLRGQALPTLRRLRADRPALRHTAWGSLFGPVIGVWLSLVAIRHTSIGVASTLMALPPVFLLPIGRLAFGERVGGRAVLGTLVAMAGVALLFLA
jgi:drug/metabolite transporter (DMT)-like permease